MMIKINQKSKIILNLKKFRRKKKVPNFSLKLKKKIILKCVQTFQKKIKKNIKKNSLFIKPENIQFKIIENNFRNTLKIKYNKKWLNMIWVTHFCKLKHT